METLQKKFSDISNNREILNKDYIEDFVCFFIETFKLEQVLQSIQFTRRTDTLSCYNSAYKTILLSRLHFYRTKLNKMNVLDINRLKDEDFFKLNSILLKILFHELNHAKQELIIEDLVPSKALISELLKQDDYMLRWQKNLYNENYSSLISEYNADIMSMIDLSIFFRQNNCDEIKSFLEKQFKVDSPIERFIRIYNPNFDISQLLEQDNCNELNDFEKIVFGIPDSFDIGAKVKILQKKRSF